MRCAIAALVLIAASCTSTPGRRGDAPPISAAEWESLVAAEDARIATPEQLALLRQALESRTTFVRATAVRALGRSERRDLAPVIAALLRDGSDSVRAAAAHALGDVTRDTASAETRRLLLEALPRPGANDAGTTAITETLGRLRTDSATARMVAQRLAPFLDHDNEARMGALRGLYFLARQPAARAAVGSAAAPRLRASNRSRAPGETGRRQRGLAIATLALAQAADEQTLANAVQDVESQVRREAVAAAGTLRDTAAMRRIISAGAADGHPAVRYEAVRVYAARLAAARGCGPVAAAVRDSSVHVALLAIDLLGGACGADANAAMLDSIAATLPADMRTWHRAAHATVALAQVAPERARQRQDALARHPSPFARTYAARAAGAGADIALLHLLARDRSVIVRTAAITALAGVAGHSADSVFAAQLTSSDSELLITAAGALEGTRDPSIPVLLLDALDRMTALRRETSRDARIALLTRVQELGTLSLADRVRPYLRDFDGEVAALSAAVLQAWTGERPAPAPRPLARQELPTFSSALRLTQILFVLEMDGGGEIEIRLLPFDAPANAARFARLARSGFFDGLTIHRVVPNFVVQGGSPNANEYSGDGPYTRDELAVPNWRGTVGLSTRGRDTGDAQFFINLVDNVRLDHEYTVFGIVTRGMDVVDRLLEGALIRRVREVPL